MKFIIFDFCVKCKNLVNFLFWEFFKLNSNSYRETFLCKILKRIFRIGGG